MRSAILSLLLLAGPIAVQAAAHPAVGDQGFSLNPATGMKHRLTKRQSGTSGVGDACPDGSGETVCVVNVDGTLQCAGTCCTNASGQFLGGCDLGTVCDLSGGTFGCCPIGETCTGGPPPCVNYGQPAPGSTTACPRDSPTCYTVSGSGACSAGPGGPGGSSIVGGGGAAGTTAAGSSASLARSSASASASQATAQASSSVASATKSASNAVSSAVASASSKVASITSQIGGGGAAATVTATATSSAGAGKIGAAGIAGAAVIGALAFGL
ncbi:MAG: hypothetical protein M1824_001255 [Vezdaea acicularis]|nr:MAG: hypothetical protein M1824_001255 [Vezdaea acicularis]